MSALAVVRADNTIPFYTLSSVPAIKSGAAVLPSRLKEELTKLGEAIVEGRDIRGDELLAKHADWVDEFVPKYEKITKENITGILQEEVGNVFARVLEDAGVYKCDTSGREAFGRFLASVGFLEK